MHLPVRLGRKSISRSGSPVEETEAAAPPLLRAVHGIPQDERRPFGILQRIRLGYTMKEALEFLITLENPRWHWENFYRQ